MEFEKYLRNFKSKHQNPFLDSSFDLVGEETYGEGCDVHVVDGVLRMFGDGYLSIAFDNSKLILGLVLAVRTLCDPYGICGFVVFINNRKIEISPSLFFDEVGLFKLLYSHTAFRECSSTTIKVAYSDKSTLDYTKQVLFYIIDKDHIDSHYRDLELKRWEEEEEFINKRK